MQILGVGVATVDLIFVVGELPREDEEKRALDLRVARGGNSGNVMVVLSQLGHRCAWAGVLADEPGSQPIRDDFFRHGVDFRHSSVLASGRSPTSGVILSQASGSRTIVHYRDLPELTAEDFARIDLRPFAWVHFEGRNVAETEQMLKRVRQECPSVTRSLEIEKPRNGIERLLPLADVLLFSRAFAVASGFGRAESLWNAVRPLAPQSDLFCAWGNEGGYAANRRGIEYHSAAVAPPRIRDTLGAGDVFNAAIIDALARGLSVEIALRAGCRLAGRKCGQYGFEALGRNSVQGAG
jgi:ketohexokinase